MAAPNVVCRAGYTLPLVTFRNRNDDRLRLRDRVREDGIWSIPLNTDHAKRRVSKV